MSEHERKYLLTLLRHGESAGNAQGIWQGHLDTQLTDLGRGQAKALASFWLQEPQIFDLVISSPLKRALETAEIIAGALNLPLETDPRLMERDSGELTGLSRAEMHGRSLAGHVYEPMGKTGESDMALFRRAVEFVERILNRPPGSYLVVSHGGLLNRLMSAVLGLQPQAFQAGTRFAFSNTGFATLEFRPDKSLWLVTGINNQPHLRGDRSPIWQG